MARRPHTLATLLLTNSVITVISVISVITIAINDSLRCDALCLLIGRIQLLTGDTLQHNRQTRTLHHTKKRASLFMTMAHLCGGLSRLHACRPVNDVHKEAASRAGPPSVPPSRQGQALRVLRFATQP